MNPFKYRPESPEDTDWEDNWLSNSLAWASRTLLPKFCGEPEHWASRLANYFWTDCPCCLFYRGFIFGVAGGAISLYVFQNIVNLLKGL